MAKGAVQLLLQHPLPCCIGSGQGSWSTISSATEGNMNVVDPASSAGIPLEGTYRQVAQSERKLKGIAVASTFLSCGGLRLPCAQTRIPFVASLIPRHFTFVRAAWKAKE